MTLINSFVLFLQPLAATMTCPSFENFLVLVTGWIFASRRTVTRMIVAAGAVEQKHHSAYHRLFATARWSRDRLGLAVFDLLEPWLGEVVFLALDDTLARKRGLKMFGTGMHHDPLLSSRAKTITNWGHSWVVLGVIIRFPLWPDRPFCLPILFRLYLNHKSAAKERRVHRTRPELGVEMLELLARAENQEISRCRRFGIWGPERALASAGELRSYQPTDAQARLYEAASQRTPGQKGRPCKRGDRLPTPNEMLAVRARRVVLKIYGRQEQARVCEAEARVFAVPERPLKVVAVEALHGGRGREAFYSTCHTTKAEDVLTWYAWRWSIEVAFHDSKQHLGFQEPQGWTRHAVERTAPVAMLLYSLIVLWFVREGHRHYRPDEYPWYRHKSRASFLDMLTTLRRESVRNQFLSLGLSGEGSRKALQALKNAVSLAI